MKGDFSRFTFNKGKHYKRVLMQQGRVQLDADINEQQAIVHQQIEDRTSDIIGTRGIPKTGGGFEISLDANGTDLAIGIGNIYVDGILCQNEKTKDVYIAGILTRSKKTATYLNQDDLPGASLPTNQGKYLVYLDVFSRTITAIDDPIIREKALGGADTSVREKIVWQVKLKQVKSEDVCSNFSSPSWQPLDSPTGMMAAGLKDVSDASNLCTPIPPTSGYRRLENQLYRVEIHKGGERSQATFKWSRENGSIEAPIRSVSGKTITLEKMSRDEALGFGNNQWMEIVTDDRELGKGVLTLPDDTTKPQGVMVKSYTVHESKPEITLASDSGISIDIDKKMADMKLHPRLRRWDHESPDSDGIRLDSEVLIELEGEIQVSFSEGTYYPGDYWLIPARTAIGDEIGEIEWPMDENTPPKALSQPRHGTYHHYCPLALVSFNQGLLALLSDCRPKFPSLTNITASDVFLNPGDSTCKFPNATTVQQALDCICLKEKSKCTLTIWPGNKWADIFNTIGDCTDIYIFFQVGTFNVDLPISLKKKSVKICGCGPGTKIIASKAETAFSFEECESVDVESLHMESALGPMGPKGTGPTHLNGTLTFSKCNRVRLRDLELVCGSGTARASACIKIGEAESVRILDCDIMPGSMQVGVLMVDAAFICLERNIIKVIPGVSDKATMLQNKVYRGGIRSQMISSAVLGKPKDKTEDVNVITVASGNFSIRFGTHPKLAGAWNAWFKNNPPSNGIQSNADLLSYVKNLADNILLSPSSPEFSPFKGWNDDLAKDVPVTAAQGVVIGGSTASEVRIINNSILGVIQGVHIGMRKRTANPLDFDFAGDVWIAGNEVKINLVPGARERHGIFVGNCQALHIKDNHIEVRKSGPTKEESIDGIRIYGHIGRRAIVRQNYIEKASVGVNFAPIRKIFVETLPPQWVVAENMISGSVNAILIPAKVPDALYALIKIENNYPNNPKRLTATKA